jgi:hypothetical protein
MAAPTRYTLYKDWMAEVNTEALRRGATSTSDGIQPSHRPNIFEAFPWVDKDNIWRDAFARGFRPASALDENGYRQPQKHHDAWSPAVLADRPAACGGCITSCPHIPGKPARPSISAAHEAL